MSPELIETLASVWQESVSFVVILALGYFSWNRMKRVDELSDARVEDAVTQNQNLAEIERETIRSMNSLKELVLAQRSGQGGA